MTPAPYRQSKQSLPQRWSETDDMVLLTERAGAQQIRYDNANRRAAVNRLRTSANLDTLMHPGRSAASAVPHRYRLITIPITSSHRQSIQLSAAASFM